MEERNPGLSCGTVRLLGPGTMKGTRERWRGRTHDFCLIAHEHLFVFRKPAEGEDLKDYRHSVKWWQERAVVSNEGRH